MKIEQIKKLLADNPTFETLSAISLDERASVQKLLAGYYKNIQQQENEKQRLLAMQEHENKLFKQGLQLIAGVDEAGRGPLAGPLVVAAVILPKDEFFYGLDDSKKLSSKKREALFEQISNKAIASSIQIISTQVIDELNIYQATIYGMKKALNSLKFSPQAALIDAMPLTDMPFLTIPLIHGDSLSVSIAGASILAKVTRDKIMQELDKTYPQYGFAKHKGYGTKEHIQAIAQYGATPEHRKSFEPIKSMFLR